MSANVSESVLNLASLPHTLYTCVRIKFSKLGQDWSRLLERNWTKAFLESHWEPLRVTAPSHLLELFYEDPDSEAAPHATDRSKISAHAEGSWTPAISFHQFPSVAISKISLEPSGPLADNLQVLRWLTSPLFSVSWDLGPRLVASVLSWLEFGSNWSSKLVFWARRWLMLWKTFKTYTKQTGGSLSWIQFVYLRRWSVV